MKQDPAQAVYRLTDYIPDPNVLRLLPKQVANECLAVPLRIEGRVLVVASAKAQDSAALWLLSQAARRPVHALSATYPDVRAALDLAYGRSIPLVQEPFAEDLCLRLGYIQAEHLPVIHEKSAKTGKSFLETCDSLGLIEPSDLVEAEALINHLPYLRDRSLGKLEDLSDLIPWELAQKQKIVPLCWAANHLVVGSPKPILPGQVRDIASHIHLPVQMVLLTSQAWEKIYRRFYLRGRIEENPDMAIARSLVRQNTLSEAALQGALSIQDQRLEPLEDVILDLNLVDRREWFQAKAKHYKVIFHDLQKSPPAESPDLNALRAKIPTEVAHALQVIPLQSLHGHFVIGMVEPSLKRIRTVEHLVGKPVETRLVDASLLGKYTGAAPGDGFSSQEICLPLPQEYAVYLGIVTPLLVDDSNQKTGTGNGENPLVASGLIDDIDFAELQGLNCNLPFARLEHVHFSEEQLLDLPRELITKYGCFTLFSSSRQLWLAVSDPLDGATLHEVEKITGKRVWPVIAPRSIIQSVIQRYVAPQQKTVHQEEIRIIEKLVEGGFLTQLEASRALQVHASRGKPLDVVIAEQSTYKPEELAPAIARIIGLPTISLALQEKETTFINPLGGQDTRTVITDPVETATAHLIDLEMAKKWCALPIKETGRMVVVAFANPDYRPAMADLQSKIIPTIVPYLAPRHELEEAIERTLGRRNLGTYLLMEGLLTRSQLNRALDLARRTGVRLGRALINRRLITAKQLYQFIARQSGLPFIELAEMEIDIDLARMIPADSARQYGMLAIGSHEEAVTLATTDPLDTTALALARKILKRPIELVVITDTDLDLALEKIYSREYLEKSISELLERTPEDSAFRVLSRGQTIFFVAFLILSAICIIFANNLYFIVLNAIFTFFYLVFSGYKLYLIYRALDQDLEVPVTAEEVAALKDSDLPIYSVLIPVYHEAKTLPDLLNAIVRFDYPSTKLDIQVIMEEDDQETIDAFNRWNPPSHFHGVIVPTAEPKTKPKACNYGLIHSRGEYVVIYDAEDLPEPDQLKKIIVAFNKTGPDVVCIQSKLNYYNHDQNLLTRWFTIEYSMWFDLFLPGLNASKAPIPLGGTSNHFRRDALLEINAWDPYNVTEDADLGIRLYKRGYKTVIIDSTTYEEANSQLGSWIRQRSRWIKGYIQTWLVHMRHPRQLQKEIGWKAFLGFQFVVGGNFFTALLNPIYWIFTTLWFVLRWQFIQQIFPSVIFYLGAACLFFGNFAFTYINVAGAMRRNYYGMVKYALLSPFYWALASIAAWRGFLQLFRNPYYWEKTTHGLVTGSNPEPGAQTQESTQPK